MTPTISAISPFFIVANVPPALAFYRDVLGFEITFRGPTPRTSFSALSAVMDYALDPIGPGLHSLSSGGNR